MFFPPDFQEKIKNSVQALSSSDSALHTLNLRHLLSSHTAKLTIHELRDADLKTIRDIKTLYRYGGITQADKKEVLKYLNNLYEFCRSDHGIGADELPVIDKIISTLRELLTHELTFLGYTPGGYNKEYVRLSDLFRSPECKLVIDKEELAISGNNILYGGRKIQGLTIHPGALGEQVIELTAEHYSSQEGIHEVYQHGYIESSHKLFSFGDKFTYVVEPSLLSSKSEQELKKILGAANAEACITIKCRLPVHFIWVRVKRDYPAKFAIEASRLPFACPKPQRGFTVRIVGGNVEKWAA